MSVYDSGFALAMGCGKASGSMAVWPFIDLHLDRLFDSCKAVSLDTGMSRDEVRAALDATASREQHDRRPRASWSPADRRRGRLTPGPQPKRTSPW